jgi:FkbM family methyltransferase
MTPEIITRSFSNDQYIFDNVFFSNYYKLKGQKEDAPVVVDIGAHCGYFTFTALTLGAKKVYCFEPFLDSFKTLLNNCYNLHFVGKVTPFQLGVYTEQRIGEFTTPQLIDGIYFDMAGVGLSTNPNENYYPCQCHKLDAILKEYCYNETIDILKINIGYAEREILLNSELLTKNVKSVCGEVSCTEEEFFSFKRDMGIKNFVNCYSLPPNKQGRILFLMSQVPLSNYYNI